MSQNKTTNVISFLIGILLIIIALFAFANPFHDLVWITVFIAVVLIIKGLAELFNRHYPGSDSGKIVLLGTLDTLLGVFLLFNIQFGMIALPYIFAICFICESLLTLFSLADLELISKGLFYFFIFMNIIGVVLGVMLLLNPAASIFTLAFLIGMYFMIHGINAIILAFQ